MTNVEELYAKQYVATDSTPGAQPGESVDVSAWPPGRIEAFLDSGRLTEKQ